MVKPAHLELGVSFYMQGSVRMSTSPRKWIRMTFLYLKPPKNLDAKQTVIVSYRYISWFITSIYYLTGPPFNSYGYKLAVVIALFVFSRVIMDYYLKSNNLKTIRLTAMIETIGLTLLLVPTRGLESPFIWYALNPVLIATNYLAGRYCWANLSFYLLSSLVISLKLFNNQGLTVTELIQAKSYIILVYVLVTVAMRLLVRLVKQLDRQAEELQRQKQELVSMNAELHEANSRVNRSMGYVMSLYHIIETFSSREDTHIILAQMVNFTSQIMECNASFVRLTPHKDDPGSIITHRLSSTQSDKLMDFLDSRASVEKKSEGQSSFELEGVRYLVAPIESSSRLYGYIGMELSAGHQEVERKESLCERSTELLSFLGDLVAVILERHHLESLSSKLIILEEQNRIGNEIHDSVSQRLFSILCGIHALNANWHRLDAETISQQLALIEQSTKDTSKELRSSIYQLSSSKRGDKVFIDNIDTYLRDFASLNNVDVSFDFDGDEERIFSSLKQALYRIVREATGNAVRHGKCRELEVKVWIHAATLELMVRDNGKGFDTAMTLQNKEGRGLGLNNMQILTQTFNGSFELVSREGVGTTLQLKFPLGYRTERVLKQEGGAA